MAAISSSESSPSVRHSTYVARRFHHNQLVASNAISLVAPIFVNSDLVCLMKETGLVD
jgi:hypothetical protein